MVPAREAAAFIVVQAELSLEVFVDALGSPALHHQADELLLGSAPRQRDEKVIGRFGLPPPTALSFLVPSPPRSPITLSPADGARRTDTELK
jgi:hypothetical protein